MRTIRFTTIAMLCILIGGCKTESKLSKYKDIYKEKPIIIYVAPTIDQAERKTKNIADRNYNNQLDVAKNYMLQSLRKPFLSKGYYVLSPLVSVEIAKIDNLTEANINDTATLKKIATKYGVDAVLFTYIYKWEVKKDDWIVYVEYILKSSKTGATLMNTKVKARKFIPTNFRGYTSISHRDEMLTKKLKLDIATSQRVLLLDLVNSYVLKDIPWSKNSKDFEKDIDKNTKFSCMEYYCEETGVEIYRPMSIEEFDQDCFLLNSDDNEKKQ